MSISDFNGYWSFGCVCILCFLVVCLFKIYINNTPLSRGVSKKSCMNFRSTQFEEGFPLADMGAIVIDAPGE